MKYIPSKLEYYISSDKKSFVLKGNQIDFLDYSKPEYWESIEVPFLINLLKNLLGSQKLILIEFFYQGIGKGELKNFLDKKFKKTKSQYAAWETNDDACGIVIMSTNLLDSQIFTFRFGEIVPFYQINIYIVEGLINTKKQFSETRDLAHQKLIKKLPIQMKISIIESYELIMSSDVISLEDIERKVLKMIDRFNIKSNSVPLNPHSDESLLTRILKILKS